MRTTLLILLVLLCSFGCQSKNPVHTVDITLKNDSTNALNWVELEWSGPDVHGGILSPGIAKTAVEVEWPLLDTAKLTFIDDKTKQPYSIEVSLSSINKQVQSGNCQHVIFRILSYSQAEAICSDKE